MPEALRIFAPVRAVAVVVAVFSTKATSTTASCGTFTTTDQRSLARYAFIGSTAARGTTTTRSVSAWKKSDVLKAPATSSTSAEPLSRRAVVRRPKSRTRFRSGGSTAADTPPPTQQGAQEPSDKSGGDVGNLLRYSYGLFLVRFCCVVFNVITCSAVCNVITCSALTSASATWWL